MIRRKSYKSFGSLLKSEKRNVLENADLSRVPFMLTNTSGDNAGFTGLSLHKLDVCVCYGRKADISAITSLLEKLTSLVKERGMEDAVDIASARFFGKRSHDTIVTIGSVVLHDINEEKILSALNSALDSFLYDAMYQAKRDLTKPHIS